MSYSQVDFLHQIASWRNSWLDPIFHFLNYFDSAYFPMTMIPLVWIGISYRWGLRFAFAFTLNSLLNFHLKLLFHTPRPIIDFPDLAMMSTASPSFPSGAAQTVILVGGLLIYGWKNKWAWAIAIPYILLISFSRLYLGVHYPIDIVGGWFFGFVVLFAFILCIKPLEKLFHKQGPGLALFLCLLFCALYILFFPDLVKGLRMVGALLGLGIGGYLAYYFGLCPQYARSLSVRILSAIFAVLSTYAIYLLFPHQLTIPIHLFILSLWTSLGAYPLSKTLVRLIRPLL